MRVRMNTTRKRSENPCEVSLTSSLNHRPLAEWDASVSLPILPMLCNPSPHWPDVWRVSFFDGFRFGVPAGRRKGFGFFRWVGAEDGTFPGPVFRLLGLLG